jgi:hypothetical protein
MLASAESAVAHARSHHGVELDYSVESVRLLEGLLEARYRANNSWWLRYVQPEKRKRALQGAALLWGAYLGEVIRRRWGGRWLMPADDVFAGLYCIELPGPFTFSPASKVFKRLTNGAEDSVWSYLSVIPDLLEQKGGGA